MTTIGEELRASTGSGRHSSYHRGDYRRVRHSVAIAMIELEALEPRMTLAYKLGEIPAGNITTYTPTPPTTGVGWHRR